jgi:hypothetical protein
MFPSLFLACFRPPGKRQSYHVNVLCVVVFSRAVSPGSRSKKKYEPLTTSSRQSRPQTRRRTRRQRPEERDVGPGDEEMVSPVLSCPAHQSMSPTHQSVLLSQKFKSTITRSQLTSPKTQRPRRLRNVGPLHLKTRRQRPVQKPISRRITDRVAKMGTRPQTACEELVGRVWDRDGLNIIFFGSF